MRTVLSTCLLLPLLAVSCISVRGAVAVSSEDAGPRPTFRHVVFFKFKDGTPQSDIRTVQRAFLDMKNKIEVVRDIESGRNVSVENLDQGFTHCFLVTFDDAAGRDAYLTHPVHDEFVKLAGPVLDKVCVIDYVPER